MVDLVILWRSFFASLFKSRARREAEILVLRRQINSLDAPRRVGCC
jgi:hypothetical protein